MFKFGGGSGLVAKSCPNSCNLMDCNPPVSSVHGIFQARKLEWVVISYSKRYIYLIYFPIYYLR